MSKISIKGILIGGLTDIISSSLLGIPFVVYVMFSNGLAHSPQAQTEVVTIIHASAFLYSIQLLIGLSCSVLGGYISARVAKHNELLNGTLASLFCLSIGVYSIFSKASSVSLPVQLLLMAVTPLCSLLGGYIRLKQVTSHAKP